MNDLSQSWPWITLILLGAYHGLNPGMGWLFAVALGLQEKSRRAVVGAFGPIAIGHALSIAVVVALFVVAESFIAPDLLRYIGAGALIAFGVYKLIARSHPRWVGMRVNGRDLTLWSFLMSTAHGAGLMLLPVILSLSAASLTAESMNMSSVSAMNSETHAAHMAPMADAGMADGDSGMGSTAVAAPVTEITAVLVHTLAMFLVMGLIAVVVYEKVGLSILRRAWFNLDLMWAGALIVAGVVMLLF